MRGGVINVMEMPKLAAHGAGELRPLGVVGMLELQGDWHIRLDLDDGMGIISRRKLL